jgi:hypothetical protein
VTQAWRCADPVAYLQNMDEVEQTEAVKALSFADGAL